MKSLFFIFLTTKLFISSASADWCSDQGLRCRLDDFSYATGEPRFGRQFQEAQNLFSQNIARTCASPLTPGTQRPPVCVQRGLSGAVADVTFLSAGAARMGRMPSSGIRLVHDCEGFHLQVNMELMSQEEGRRRLFLALNELPPLTARESVERFNQTQAQV